MLVVEKVEKEDRSAPLHCTRCEANMKQCWMSKLPVDRDCYTSSLKLLTVCTLTIDSSLPWSNACFAGHFQNTGETKLKNQEFFCGAVIRFRRSLLCLGRAKQDPCTSCTECLVHTYWQKQTWFQCVAEFRHWTRTDTCTFKAPWTSQSLRASACDPRQE